MASWLWAILIVYGILVFALSVWTYGKPFTFNYRGQRIPVRIPLLRLLMVMWLAAFVLFSVPMHFLCRVVGLRGFYDRRTKNYGTQNPFKRI